MTRATYFDRRWPDSPVFQDVAKRWSEGQSRHLLDLVWRGYDSLLQSDLRKVPMSKDDEGKEESLNSLLAGKISESMTGDEPFWCQPQPFETHKRKRGRGKSPTPDIGFVLYDSPRSVWPLEGKVLHNVTDIGAYIKEVKDNFLTARYSTFSREGAMLGFLLEGDPLEALEKIGTRLIAKLARHPYFLARPHRISIHLRKLGRLRKSPEEFLCHHLILVIPTTM